MNRAQASARATAVPRGVLALSQPEREALREAARLELARRHLIDFVRLTSHGYLAGWFHRDLCARLERFSEAVARGESPRLIIAVPPRHGKTHIVSQRFPVWHLARNPRHEIICASYAAELALDNSRAAREVARSEEALGAFPSLKPEVHEKRYYADYRRADVDRVDNWKVGGGGSYKAVGRGGAVTGRGAHVLIIDDPLKDRQEADSPTIRRQLWEWYTSTAYTRLAPGGGVIVMATRWHEADLTGKLLEEARKGGEQWEVVEYPAIALEDEPQRRAGEALHPERYPVPALLRIKRAVGSREWAALYEQRPTPSSGGTYHREWFRRVYHEDPQRMAMDEWAISVDCSFKKTDDSDYVVMQAWGRRGMDAAGTKRWGEATGYFPLDQVRARMTYPEMKAALKRFAAKWPRATLKLVEDKANGSALIDDLRAELPGLVAYDPTPDGSKVSRAGVTAVAWEAGNCWVPSEEFAPWVGDFIEEHVSFPAGANDDQVDAGSQMLRRWLNAAQNDPLERTKRQFGFLHG